MNLADHLGRTAARHGTRTAVELGDASLGYAELDALAGRTAAMLADRGVRPGDRVGLMMPNLVEFPVLFYGALRAGAIVVPMNPLLKSREIAHCLRDSGAVLVFAHEPASAEAAATAAAAGDAAIVPVGAGSLPELLAGHTEPVTASVGAAGDTAVIFYTSGTTGLPKGAELSHDNIARNCRIARSLFDLTERDRVLGALPLFHAFGQVISMITTVGVGARLTLLGRFEPEPALRTMQDRRITVFAGVPTMYAAMLNVHRQAPGAHDVAPLRLCVSGGASLPVEVLRGFEEAFGCMLLEGFGMSETSPIASFNHPDRPRRAGSVGTPIEGVEMRLADVRDGVGELCVRGHNVMKGYWNRPDATAETIKDGWLHTGDLARVDDDGYYYIVDRKKDLIIRGGFNVYPREIEEVLYEHPAVAEAAVIGLPHEALGEEIAAAVVLRPGAEASPDELRDFVRRQVAPYKYPREVWLLDALPKGATGKILKREITAPTVTRN